MKKVIENISLALSGIFSPLLVPTYACAIALWITPLSIVAERARFMVCAIVCVITAVIPMATIIFMMRAGKVSDSSISNRRERGIPYTVTLLCYLLAALFLWYEHAPQWLSMFFVGAAFVSIVALLVTLVWKISAHAMVMGGLCGMLFFFAFHHLAIVSMLPWISLAIILSGAVCSARLFLRRHTQLQVYAGFLLGLIGEYVFMTL